MSEWSSMRRWVDRRVLPTSMIREAGEAPHPDASATRMVVLTCLILPPGVVLIFLLRMLLTGPLPWAEAVSLLALPLLWALPWLVWKQQDHRTAALLLQVLGSVVVFYRIALSGGLQSPVLAWLPLVAITAAVLLRGWQAALVIGLTLAGMAGLAAAPLVGIELPVLPLPPHTTFLSTALAMVLVAGTTGMLARSQRKQLQLYQTAVGELRATNEELARTSARAEAASEAKGAFLASMSHEIRTPMNGVLGMTQLLADTELSPEQARMLQTLDRSARHLLRVIDDVLDVSKLDAGRIELDERPLEVRRLLSEVVDLFRPRADSANLFLALDVGEDVPEAVVGDDVRIRQVLINLVGNALKFTESGGVRVRVQQLTRLSQRAALRFEVVDTGIGIAPDAIEHLFDRFTQAEPGTTRRFGGTGLGLAIVKGLVEAMGGRLGARSTPGQGSTFWFELMLPVVGVESVTSDESSAFEGTQLDTERLAALRVLVVDDNVVNRTVAASMLQRLGHDPVVAEGGRHGLQILADEPVDLVLLDIEMPDLDGYETAQAIRQQPALQELPVVALTAHAMPQHVAQARAAGMNDHLAKPIIVDKLQRVLERWAHRASDVQSA